MATTTTTCSSSNSPLIPAVDPQHVATIQKELGPDVRVEPLEPLGVAVYGMNLAAANPPPEPARLALEREMATRGFVVFKNQHDLSVKELLAACRWFGGRQIHSTHGVHPATPNNNRDIFRLSNDPRHGIVGVGPQWHNDGSFVAGTFSHAAYHIIHVPQNGGGTQFAHQGAAFDMLPNSKQEFWKRLVSVNSNSGVLHPVVHQHPVSGRTSVWLHLGMTGAVIECLDNGNSYRLLTAAELKQLMVDYNDLLNRGLTSKDSSNYTIPYEYEQGDVLLMDNLAVAHRAAPQAHMHPAQQGLRILHRVTVHAVQDFPPGFGLPQYLDIYAPNPFHDKVGVWKGGGIGFRWDDEIHMQN